MEVEDSQRIVNIDGFKKKFLLRVATGTFFYRTSFRNEKHQNIDIIKQESIFQLLRATSKSLLKKILFEHVVFSHLSHTEITAAVCPQFVICAV